MLDIYVESDYVVVYFHHGLTSDNRPSFKWLRMVYSELERKLVLYCWNGIELYWLAVRCDWHEKKYIDLFDDIWYQLLVKW